MMNATTFVIATGQGRDYPWQCEDSVTTQQWSNSIQYVIYQANEAIQKVVDPFYLAASRFISSSSLFRSTSG